MNYLKYNIITSPENAEIFIALLSLYPFDTFQETETGLDAFLPENQHEKAIDTKVEELSDQFQATFSKTLIPAQNWNKVWESNFQPIIVDNFCGIRADFHDPIAEVQHEIVINPKMAFGTGHHATTYMVIQHMENLDFTGKKVFDFGCGTGILAILAAKLGATTIEAVDIEQASYENTIENAKINEISGINCVHGILDDVPGDQFDIILANINRNVILDALPSLYTMLAKNGKLIVSGFIEQDKELLTHTSELQGFSPLKTSHKDNWISIVFDKD